MGNESGNEKGRVHMKAALVMSACVALATVTTGDAAAGEGERRQKLFLDEHDLGPGKVRAEDVATAHRRDLAVQGKHGARFLNYWFDEATGTVNCLVEARTAKDALAAHKEAHGLMPERIEEVREGR